MFVSTKKRTWKMNPVQAALTNKLFQFVFVASLIPTGYHEMPMGSLIGREALPGAQKINQALLGVQTSEVKQYLGACGYPLPPSRLLARYQGRQIDAIRNDADRVPQPNRPHSIRFRMAKRVETASLLQMLSLIRQQR